VSRPGLKLLIEIDERKGQSFGEDRTDRGLAGTPRPNQPDRHGLVIQCTFSTQIMQRDTRV
jgi:hypothetical protein